MSELLKIGSSFTTKTQNQPISKTQQASEVFNVQDSTSIAKAVEPRKYDQESNTNQEFGNQQPSSTILVGLLKDPDVTVTFLKNISMMQELMKLLPLKNNSITQEIEMLFNSLLVPSGEITNELLSQQENASSFRGAIFDMLRQMLQATKSTGNQTDSQAILDFIKALNSQTTKGQISTSVANSLLFLSDTLSPSQKLSQSLAQLSEKFRNVTDLTSFINLKKELAGAESNIRNSILFSPKIEKILSLINYNVSRFNTNPTNLEQATKNLMDIIANDQAQHKFTECLTEYLQNINDIQNENTSSKVMDILTKIVQTQADSDEIASLTGHRVETIIQSLLSSPCNFTPLLHFVVPLQEGMAKAFAEMWINPDGEADQKGGKKAETNIHMLIVFDIENVGRFETELFARDKKLELTVLCPENMLNTFEALPSKISKGIQQSGYRLENVNIKKLERTRSLMEVFKSLPQKRAGVDVKA